MAGASPGAPPPAPEPPALHLAEDDLWIRVEQPRGGFWCTIALAARVPLPPAVVFELLTDPVNARLFSSIKATRDRRVVTDDGHGRKEVDVVQVGRWRLGPLSGSFPVHMRVTQDRRAGTIDFRLVPSKRAFMRDFRGTWTLRHYNRDAEEELLRAVPGAARRRSALGALAAAAHRLEDALSGQREESLVCLRQSLAPALAPPPPLDRLVQKIAAWQIRHIMRDLLAEADRRNRLEAAEARRRRGGGAEPARLEAHVRELREVKA